MFKYSQYNQGNLVEEISFETKKEAREHLNLRVREAKAANNQLKTYYQESNNFYSVKDLRLASEIEAEENGLKDLGDEEPAVYMEIVEIEEI